MIDAQNIEELLKSSNLIYKRGWDAGFEAGREYALQEFNKIIDAVLPGKPAMQGPDLRSETE